MVILFDIILGNGDWSKAASNAQGVLAYTDYNDNRKLDHILIQNVEVILFLSINRINCIFTVGTGSYSSSYIIIDIYNHHNSHSSSHLNCYLFSLFLLTFFPFFFSSSLSCSKGEWFPRWYLHLRYLHGSQRNPLLSRLLQRPRFQLHRSQ